MSYKIQNIRACFLGFAVADALGVPVEFTDRHSLKASPVTTMLGYGTWNQPPGTWSDDSSLAFCLAESLLNGYDINDIGTKFVRWFREGYWGAHHKIFDVGGATRAALTRIINGEDARYSGEFEEESNGNGSLMRIIPASLYFFDTSDSLLLERIREVSAITHAHFRSVFSCFIYSKFVIELLKGSDKQIAFQYAVESVSEFITQQNFNPDEIKLFDRLLTKSILQSAEKDIRSSGYVLDTLEAGVWCFLTSTSYQETVLKAVNLGGDTDTTACVAGGLAGLYYGLDAIPNDWQQSLARRNDIIKLAEDFTECLKKRVLP